jgi:small subunit ribosomal protein S8
MFDPISDMLIRIKNAQRAGKKDVIFPCSKLKLSLAKILEKENFIEMFKKEKDESWDNIRIVLKYEKVSNNKKVPVINEIKRISKLSRRIYIKKDEIKTVRSGYGISIISTSKGVMTGKDARKLGLGGEFICEVW